MREIRVRGSWMLASVASLCGCMGLLPKPNGAHTVTDEDRAAPLDNGYACLSTESITADGGEAGSLPNHFEVRRGGAGPVLISGRFAATNHWQGSDGEHFFSYYDNIGGLIGTETIIAADHQTAIQMIYSPQTNDPEALVIEPQPDDTKRPRGTPVVVASCYSDATVAQASKSGKHVLPLVDIAPVHLASDSFPDLIAMPDPTCSRKGPHGDQIATEKLEVAHQTTYTTTIGGGTQVQNNAYIVDTGSFWQWTPTVAYVTASVPNAVFIGFGNAGLGSGWNRHFFRVGIGADGNIAFTIGQVAYEGRMSPPDANHHVAMELAARTLTANAALWCHYQSQ